MTDRTVSESWGTITRWLAENLPSATEYLQPPAKWSEVTALSVGVGRRLPSDLVAWLTINNGFTHAGSFGSLLPVTYTPMPIERMLERREQLRGIYAGIDRPGEHEPAGTPSSEWLDAFLPIGDSGTDCELFVDLRGGELHGCVGDFDAEFEGFGVPEWFSVTEMLNDVADAVALGKPALQDHGRRYHAATPYSSPPSAWRPYIEDNRLHWTSVDTAATVGGPESRPAGG